MGIDVTSRQVDEFHGNGWTRLPGLLTSQADTLRDGFLEKEQEEYELKDYGAQGYQGDPRYRAMMRNNYDLRISYPDIADLIRDSVQPVAAALLGTDDLRIWWDQTFTKPPAQEGTRETVWHQDLPFWPFDRRGALTFWIAVEDVSLEQGPLKFVSKSHRLGPLGRLDLVGSEPALGEVLNERDLEFVGDIETQGLRQGDATVHDALLVHGANENRSEIPRRGWGVTFIPGDTLYTGAPHVRVDGLDMNPNEPFDHELFRL